MASMDGMVGAQMMPVFCVKSLELADAIARHDFDLREWRILDFIRRQSLGSGRTRAYVPRLELFALATRITRGNVSTILRRLQDCRVIEEAPQWYYGFLLVPPPADLAANWRIPIRMGEIEVIRQLELLEQPENLQEGLRESFVVADSTGNKPAAAAGSYMGGRNTCAVGGAERIQAGGVPESGTAVHEAGCSRIGNGRLKRVQVNTYKGVPESGTVHGTCNMLGVHTPNSMLHAIALRKFNVGTLSAMTGQEIFDAMIKTTGPLEPEHQSTWWRRIGENARLVFKLAMEARQRHDVSNKAGWANVGYMAAMKIGRFAEDTAADGREPAQR